MILDVKKYKLDNKELEKVELKLMLLLSDNYAHSVDECRRYIKRYGYVSIYNIIKKLNKKFKGMTLIRNVKGRGYYTLSDIEITY